MKRELSLIPYCIRTLRVNRARSCINCLKLRSRIYSKGSWKSDESSLHLPRRGIEHFTNTFLLLSGQAARLEILTVYDLAFSWYVDSTSIICVQRKTLGNVMLASRIYIYVSWRSLSSLKSNWSILRIVNEYVRGSRGFLSRFCFIIIFNNDFQIFFFFNNYSLTFSLRFVSF